MEFLENNPTHFFSRLFPPKMHLGPLQQTPHLSRPKAHGPLPHMRPKAHHRSSFKTIMFLEQSSPSYVQKQGLQEQDKEVSRTLISSTHSSEKSSPFPCCPHSMMSAIMFSCFHHQKPSLFSRFPHPFIESCASSGLEV
ncbi:hypothetical protein Droror1_Dr00000175 [Drosera rotundifolia]